MSHVATTQMKYVCTAASKICRSLSIVLKDSVRTALRVNLGDLRPAHLSDRLLKCQTEAAALSRLREPGSRHQEIAKQVH